MRQATTVALVLIFLAITSQWSYLGSGQDLTLAQIQQTLSRPDPLRLLGFAGLAVMAAWLLSRKPFPNYSRASKILGLLMAWAGLSLLWSADPWPSAQRLAGLLAYLGCALGLATQCSPSDLRRMARDGSGALVLTACFLESATAAVNLAPGFPERLSGPFHPNTLGALCATWLLCLVPDWPASRTCRLFSLLALVCLLLTGSRASLVAGAVSVSIFLYSNSIRRSWPGIALVALTLPGFLWFVTKLRNLEAFDLNGRVLLWGKLVQSVTQSPWIGHGYEAFWRPVTIERISRELDWPVASAHSAPLEILLGLGVVGLGLVIGFLFPAVQAVYRSEPGVERSFALSLFAMAFLTSLVESTFVRPYSFYGLLTTALFLKGSATPNRPGTKERPPPPGGGSGVC